MGENWNEQNGGQNNSGAKWFIILGVIGLLYMFITVSSNSGSSRYNAKDLQDAQIKRATNQKISREDEIMLKGFDKWKSDQNKYTDP